MRPHTNTRILTRTRSNLYLQSRLTSRHVTSRHAFSEMCVLRVRTRMQGCITLRVTVRRQVETALSSLVSRRSSRVALPESNSFPFYGSHLALTSHKTHGEGGGWVAMQKALGVMLTRRGNIGRISSFTRCSADLFRLDRDATHHGDTADPPLTIPCDQPGSAPLIARTKPY